MKRGFPGAPRTLALDIGGTGIKAIVLDPSGKPVTERSHVETPRPATPCAVIAAIEGLANAPPMTWTSRAYDQLHIGRGNAEKIAIDLPESVRIVPNVAGLLGGIVLWRD